MKNDFTIEEIWPEEAILGALEVLDEGCLSFVEMAEQLDLRRSCDFQNSNLSGVDFSYCDLRGFDFSGADLRFAKGVGVKVDETTILTGATVGGSIFQNIVEQRRVFKSTPQASHLYEILKAGDPYSVSSWVSDRDGKLLSGHLSALSESDASVICKKLILDDIDLTKRTTLFYHLDKIAPSTTDLQMVVSEFVAFHADDPSVIRSFVEIAGRRLSRDEFVAKTILSLCGHRDVNVKEAAFEAITKTPLFSRSFVEIKNLFLAQANAELRKQVILNSAIALGREFVLSINIYGQSVELDRNEVLDFHELQKDQTTLLVRASQGRRRTIQSDQEIRERQQEVLANSLIFREILSRQKVEWLEKAMERTQKRKFLSDVELANSIERQWRR